MRNWNIKKVQVASDNKSLLEKDIQQIILNYLSAMGIEVSITNADRTWGKGGGVRKSKVPKGHPDLTAVLPVYMNSLKIGLALYIEVKTATGTVKPEQREKLLKLDAQGALCIVARSLDDVRWLVDGYINKEWSETPDRAVREILDITLNMRRSKTTKDRIQEILSTLKPQVAPIK